VAPDSVADGAADDAADEFVLEGFFHQLQFC